jgi:hypothetical protein
MGPAWRRVARCRKDRPARCGAFRAGRAWLLIDGLAVFPREFWCARGAAIGLIIRGGLSEINRQAEPAHRAEAVSAFLAAAYLGLGLPVVLIGAIALAVGPVDASAWVAGFVAATILAAALVVTRTFGKTAQVTPSPAHSDSWCNPQPVTEAPIRPASRSAAR